MYGLANRNTQMISRILIAVEDFLFTNEIETFLAQLQAAELELKILHVVDPAEAVQAWPSSEYRTNAEDLLKTMSKRLGEKFPNYEIETLITEGKPKDSIVEEAKNWKAELILMGPHGRKGIGKWLLGSTSKAVIPLSPCNVVVLRPSKGLKDEKAGMQEQCVQK